MPPTNKAVVAALLEGFNARDWDGVADLFASSYVNHNPPAGVPGTKDGQLGAMKGLVGAFPDARAEATHVVAEADIVVVRDIVRGTHKGEFAGQAATGNAIETTFIHVYRIEGGKIAERWGLIDEVLLLRQVGALPAA